MGVEGTVDCGLTRSAAYLCAEESHNDGASSFRRTRDEWQQSRAHGPSRRDLNPRIRRE
jgi:hypothetical protein